MPFIPLAIESAADAITQFGQLISSGFNIITSNWALALTVIVPVGASVIGVVMALIRR